MSIITRLPVFTESAPIPQSWTVSVLLCTSRTTKSPTKPSDCPCQAGGGRRGRGGGGGGGGQGGGGGGWADRAKLPPLVKRCGEFATCRCRALHVHLQWFCNSKSALFCNRCKLTHISPLPDRFWQKDMFG